MQSFLVCHILARMYLTPLTHSRRSTAIAVKTAVAGESMVLARPRTDVLSRKKWAALTSSRSFRHTTIYSSRTRAHSSRA